ncbi:disintegrin and metalloproteinase domain-containing protein 10-like [Mya arenaria]|uniref:disintegrin and metalloproteinase domain-containing protein 10-like n=1 Tax=Mya arenaria TaxID=6604 RepID=UPI0022DEAC14|nr:disintegrin and metalloproteinase domain-containing protein 10-like [Mya arenaria]
MLKNERISIFFKKETIIDKKTVIFINRLHKKHSYSEKDDILLYRAVVKGQLSGHAVIKIFESGLYINIQTVNETYILEPASLYFDHEEKQTVLYERSSIFVCVFYRGSDIKFNRLSTKVQFPVDFVQKFNETYGQDFDTAHRDKRSLYKTECNLHVLSDHTFFRDTGHSSVANTISEMAYMTAQANLVFRSTDLNGDGKGDNVGFYIKKITIYETDDYLMAHEEDVAKYLELFSEYDNENFCLATVFTSREFDGGVVGLAWVASSNVHSSPGGICQKRITYQGKGISLNTNLVTNVNNNRKMPSYLTALTLIHEFGHNFGSPHDDVTDEECVPKSDYGNYLMYPYTSDADKPNNLLFSQCSINYMFPVLKNKAQCFQDSVSAVCGNGVVEEGEECDCGASVLCADLDPCCTPSDVLDSDLPCTLRRSLGSQCSPTTSVCCSSKCQFVSSNENVVCKFHTECTLPSYCDSHSDICPLPNHVANNTPCANDRNTCRDGRCVGSICATGDMDECKCSGEHVCYICCLHDDLVCRPALTGKGKVIYKSLGQDCNDRKGFCDGKGDCITLDPEGVINRLNEMFSEDDAVKVRKWFQSHWYYVLLAIVCLAGLVGLFVKTCRGEDRVQTHAFMYGKFGRIQREAELQKTYLEMRKVDIKRDLERTLQRIADETSKMGLPQAVARLMVFFPTVSPEVILQALRLSGSEKVAVKWLLIRNKPFRRLYKPQPQDCPMEY